MESPSENFAANSLTPKTTWDSTYTCFKSTSNCGGSQFGAEVELQFEFGTEVEVEVEVGSEFEGNRNLKN